MKKPLFDTIDRQIIREDQSLSASRMKLTITSKRFQKEFMKSGLGRLLLNTVELLARCKWVK